MGNNAIKWQHHAIGRGATFAAVWRGVRFAVADSTCLCADYVRYPYGIYPSVHAPYNWWGHGDVAYVAGRIWERRDDDNLIRVEYQPPLRDNSSVLEGQRYFLTFIAFRWLICRSVYNKNVRVTLTYGRSVASIQRASLRKERSCRIALDCSCHLQERSRSFSNPFVLRALF